MSETQTSAPVERHNGVVRKLRDGYGFIAGHDGTDYFLHWTAMQKDGKTFRELSVGDRVEYTIFNAPKGPRAIDVKVTG